MVFPISRSSRSFDLLPGLRLCTVRVAFTYTYGYNTHTYRWRLIKIVLFQNRFTVGFTVLSSHEIYSAAAVLWRDYPCGLLGRIIIAGLNVRPGTTWNGHRPPLHSTPDHDSHVERAPPQLRITLSRCLAADGCAYVIRVLGPAAAQASCALVWSKKVLKKTWYI